MGENSAKKIHNPLNVSNFSGFVCPASSKSLENRFSINGTIMAVTIPVKIYVKITIKNGRSSLFLRKALIIPPNAPDSIIIPARSIM
jgi:hypothetical protein